MGTCPFFLAQGIIVVNKWGTRRSFTLPDCSFTQIWLLCGSGRRSDGPRTEGARCGPQVSQSENDEWQQLNLFGLRNFSHQQRAAQTDDAANEASQKLTLTFSSNTDFGSQSGECKAALMSLRGCVQWNCTIRRVVWTEWAAGFECTTTLGQPDRSDVLFFADDGGRQPTQPRGEHVDSTE